MGEQLSDKQQVVGSTPTFCKTNLCLVLKNLKQRDINTEIRKETPTVDAYDRGVVLDVQIIYAWIAYLRSVAPV